jgi:starvation-inducible DNA-binding protein
MFEGESPMPKAATVPVIDARKNAQVAQALSRFLATTYALYVKTQFYHWNVTGPEFYSLHKLFEEQYAALQEAADTIAERIRALGHPAPGTLAEFAALSAIEEDRKLPSSSRQMIANLLKGNEIGSREASGVLEIAEKAGDEVTVDLMIQRMTAHDKAAWMLRSLAE